jgi:hypothetical protein
MDQGLVADQNSATKAIGYRQSLEFLQNCRKSGSRPDGKGMVHSPPSLPGSRLLSSSLAHHPLFGPVSESACV